MVTLHIVLGLVTFFFQSYDESCAKMMRLHIYVVSADKKCYIYSALLLWVELIITSTA